MEIASAGSIIRVSNAITAAGRPSPRNPFTIPATKKVIIIKITIDGSDDGKKKRSKFFIVTFPINLKRFKTTGDS